MSGTNDIFEALQCGRPWVGAVANQPALLCGIGLADPFLRSNISGPETTRYSSGAFTFTRLGAAGAGVPGAIGDLALATNAQIVLFVDGLTDLLTVEGLWWAGTVGDTNLGAGGNPIDRQLGFMCCGMTVEAPDPFQRLATAAVALATTNVRYYPAFLRPLGGAGGGSGYNFQLKSAVLNNVGVQVQFGNLGITNRLGLLAQYPAWGGPGNGGNGSTNSPLMYQPFQAAMLIGPQNEMTKLQMTLFMGQGTTIANIAAFPTAAALSDATALLSGDVFQPVRVSMVGYIVCVPQDILCGVPVSFPQQGGAPSQVTYSSAAQPSQPGQQGGLGIKSGGWIR